ncbi:MAG: SpoIIE family protein phosphatase [Methylococcales bacterium]|nr:SpoIIE family protein phosphatase [Methylococcales bacterium]
MKLLIAEDELISRTLLGGITQKWGYEVILTEDGEEAWQVLQDTDDPLLLLIDWEMPRLDGLGLCRRIRQQITKRPVFIILLTARGGINDMVAGLEAGANDYIVKPFANAELHARLQVGLRMLELQSELNKAQDVLNFERETIENIILKMRSSKSFEGKNIRCLEVPVEKTSGDILLSASTPDGTRHVFLGDFTGHGLTAAVAGPTVYDIFYTMTAKGFKIQDITLEINKQLLVKMPTSLFLAAIFIELCPDGQSLSLLNCGMLDILIYQQSELRQRVPSDFLALGILKQDFKPVKIYDIEKGDRIYAFSDGITEAHNSEGEEFSQKRLELAISELYASHSDIDFLSRTVNQFRGQAKQFDDITLVELTC